VEDGDTTIRASSFALLKVTTSGDDDGKSRAQGRMVSLSRGL
jgi:hypothetical protein